MADPEVATKAPENDAFERSIFPNDTMAQEGASMGVGIWTIRFWRRAHF